MAWSLIAGRTPTDVFTTTDNLDYTQVIASISDSFFVDTNHGSASDSNPGTEALPWKTIQKAAATLTAGETVYVKNGTYIAAAGCSWTTPAINPANSGTAGNPIAFRAYPGHMPTVTNSVTGSSCPCIGAKNRNYIIWDGFEVVNANPKGVVIDDSTEIIIERCKIHGMYESGSDNCDGIRVEDSLDITVRNNEIYDIRNAGGNGNAAAVKIYNSRRVLIENNEVYDADAGPRNKVSGREITFRYNWIRDCSRWGMEAKNGTDLVYGNIITDCDTAIRVDDTTATPSTTLDIYNNTFARDNDSIVLNGDTPGCDVWNNIFYDSGAPASGMDYCAYNLYWIGSTGCGAEVVANPKFVDSIPDDPDGFKLQATSPAIGAGLGGDDIGAYATGGETIGRY
jgi:hypothetical protein